MLPTHRKIRTIPDENSEEFCELLDNGKRLMDDRKVVQVKARWIICKHIVDIMNEFTQCEDTHDWEVKEMVDFYNEAVRDSHAAIEKTDSMPKPALVRTFGAFVYHCRFDSGKMHVDSAFRSMKLMVACMLKICKEIVAYYESLESSPTVLSRLEKTRERASRCHTLLMEVILLAAVKNPSDIDERLGME